MIGIKHLCNWEFGLCHASGRVPSTFWESKIEPCLYQRVEDHQNPPCKAFYYKTHPAKLLKMYKVLKTRENLKDVKLAQTKSQKLSVSPTKLLVIGQLW
jgi:hypothetical protein